jgi:hypothetical protein
MKKDTFAPREDPMDDVDTFLDIAKGEIKPGRFFLLRARWYVFKQFLRSLKKETTDV